MPGLRLSHIVSFCMANKIISNKKVLLRERNAVPVGGGGVPTLGRGTYPRWGVPTLGGTYPGGTYPRWGYLP